MSATVAAGAATAVLFHVGPAAAQCDLPELVKGADTYNELVCKASAAAKGMNDKRALDFYLAALNEPVLESPNVWLFADIAKTYAKLGRFHEADVYMKYDNLSVLWMIGIIRCKKPNSRAERLYQDGKLMLSEEATRMADVLCGPVFDEFSYFRDSDTTRFVPAARAILKHEAIRHEIAAIRSPQHPAP
ncbi:MAG TPA: hypothetical protein VGH20_14425 [Myxococcales bacterium]|jgi:hypothetical protein